MPDSPLDVDDRALNALLAGNDSAAGELRWLTSFVEDLSAMAAGPAPVVRPALACLLVEGISTEEPLEAARPKWRKKMLIGELISGISARLAGLGLAAKAAMGLTVAAASFTGAAAAGVLPPAVQHAVSTAVDSTTPFQVPDKPVATTLATVNASVDASADADGIELEDGPERDSSDRKSADDAKGINETEGVKDKDDSRDNHGACVSAVAKSAPHGPGGIHGAAVSSAAHSCPGGATTTTTVEVTADIDEKQSAKASKGLGNDPKTHEDGDKAGHGPSDNR